MISNTHLRRLVEVDQGSFVLCSTKQTKPHYGYKQHIITEQVFPVTTSEKEH